MKNSNPYNSGIADCWYSGSGGDLWVEFKWLPMPKRDTTVINLIQGKNPMLSRLQQQWLEGRCNEGRSVGVMLGCEKGGIWLPDLNWQHGFTTREMKSWLMTNAKLAEVIRHHVEL